MNAVGIDISKGKSMIAVMRPFGEVVVSPFEVRHTDSELSELARLLQSLDGETRVVMEYTGNYHAPVAWSLHDAGIYVSVVNAMLVYDYGNNSLRRAKTDKKDAVKLANYALDHWLTLPRYIPEEDTRLMLKNCYRQYEQYSKLRTMLKNNLISLLDQVFPDANRLFANHFGLVSSELWVQCQYKLDGNRQIGGNGKGKHTWLSGLLKCADCGYSVKVNRDGEKYYLVCSGRSTRITLGLFRVL